MVPVMSTLEGPIEAHAVKIVKLLGGFSLKGDKVAGRRFIDRICILPGGRTVYLECKRPRGGRRLPLQIWYIERLREMGHTAFFVKTQEEVERALGYVSPA